MGTVGGIDCREHHLNVNFVRLVESARKDEDCLMQQVERFWAIENYGLAGDSNVCMSVEDKKALAIMERSVKLDQGHYQVALPWSQYPPFLPYNRPKMKNSSKVTRPPWKSTERYRLTRFM